MRLHPKPNKHYPKQTYSYLIKNRGLDDIDHNIKTIDNLDKKFFAVNTKTGREKFVKDRLDCAIDKGKISIIEDVISPKKEVTTINSSYTKKEGKSVIPGYIILRLKTNISESELGTVWKLIEDCPEAHYILESTICENELCHVMQHATHDVEIEVSNTDYEDEQYKIERIKYMARRMKAIVKENKRRGRVYVQLLYDHLRRFKTGLQRRSDDQGEIIKRVDQVLQSNCVVQHE